MPGATWRRGRAPSSVRMRSAEITAPRDLVGLVRRLLDLRDAPPVKVFRFTPPEASGLQPAVGAA